MIDTKLAQMVTEQTSTLLAYWDANEICRYANRPHLKWFGKTPEEMINKITLKQLLGPVYELNQSYIVNVLKGKTQVFYQDIVLPTGELKHTIINYHPDDEEGIINGFFVNVADIGALTLSLTEPGIIPNSATKIFKENKFTPAYIADPRIKEAALYLSSQIFNEFPGLLVLSKKFGVSLAKLKRDFKKVYELTPLNYFRKQQMIYANQQLKIKKLSRKELAAMFKFSNPSNFSAQFKKFITNVSIQKRMTSILFQNQKLYELYLKETPLAVAMVDENLNYMITSREWLKAYQLEDKEITGEPFMCIPELTDHFRNNMHNCLQNKHNSTEEYCYQADDGSVQWIKSEIRLWHIDEYNIDGLLVFTEDITQKKEEENLLSRRYYF